jgi:hypothetical protein
MSIVSKFIAAIRGGRESKPATAPVRVLEPLYAILTVKFDPSRVTVNVKADLEKISER